APAPGLILTCWQEVPSSRPCPTQSAVRSIPLVRIRCPMPDCELLHVQGNHLLCRHPKSRAGPLALMPTSEAQCGRCQVRGIPCEPLAIPLRPVVPFATQAPQPEPIPESGPGTELKRIFEQLGFGEFS